MNTKTFKLSHSETYWDAKVEIDTANPATDKAIKDMVQFWSEWEIRLDANKGDYTMTFLKMLGRKLVYMQLDKDLNLKGVISEMSTEEGWYPLDGSFGIKLISCSSAEVSDDDLFIS